MCHLALPIFRSNLLSTGVLEARWWERKQGVGQQWQCMLTCKSGTSSVVQKRRKHSLIFITELVTSSKD